MIPDSAGSLDCQFLKSMHKLQWRTRKVIGNLLPKLAAQHRINVRMRWLGKLRLRKWHCMTSELILRKTSKIEYEREAVIYEETLSNGVNDV
jgi:hypothetical protein